MANPKTQTIITPSIDELLSELGGQTWQPPARPSGASAIAKNVRLLMWPEIVSQLAEKLAGPDAPGLVLPAAMPPRHPHSSHAGLLCHAPKNLEELNLEVPKQRGAQRRPVLNLLQDIANGNYNGRDLPSLADGERLPLATLLTILLLNRKMYVDNSYLRSLWDSRAHACIMGVLANVTRRYVVCDNEDGTLYLVRDFYAPTEN